MYKVRKYLLSHQVAPKWMVFLFDTFIGAISVIIANLLRFNFDFETVLEGGLFKHLILVIITNSLFFFVFKTYQGIIRFSGFAEAIRTTTALFASFLLLSALNVGLIAFGQAQVLIPTSILIITLLAGSFIMVAYRLVVKTMYRASLSLGQQVNVLIYGGEINGSQLKTTIEQASKQQYKVVGFVDDDPSYVGKSIDNIKIYSIDQLQQTIEEWGDVGMILFAKPELEAEVKNQVVDFCLANDIQVRNIPPIEQWISGQLNITQLKEIRIEELLGRPQIKLQNQHVKDLISCKRVLITGAAGSIGSELARQVASIKPSVLVLCDQNETGLYELEYELRNHFPDCNIALFIGDVREESSMESLFKRFHPQILFHAAAYKHVPMMEYHPSEAIRNNVMGTKILADLSIEHDVERFLFVSTDKAINPTNVMGASKRIAEIYCQSLGNRNKKVVHLSSNMVSENGLPSHKSHTKFITTRFGNVLGSNGSVIPRFKEQIAAGGPVTVTHPDIIRFFMTIPEACSLLLEAVTMGDGGEVLLFDMGEPVRIQDLARKMIKLAGYVPGKDIEIKFTGLRPGEKLYEELLNKKEEVIPTHHKKILIARVAEYDFYAVNKSIDNLLHEAFQNNDENVVRQMKSLVPEYISNNSIYQSFDEMNKTQVTASN